MKFTPLLALLAAGALCSSCVVIKSVDADELPLTWREALASNPINRAPFAGVFRAQGQFVRSDGKTTAWPLVALFFEGRYHPRERPYIDRGELKITDSGKLTFTGFRGDTVVIKETFEAKVDRATGGLVVSIPVSDKYNKFGRMAVTRSAQLQIGRDGALYGKVRNSGAGIILFMPTVGTQSSWGRWDPLP